MANRTNRRDFLKAASLAAAASATASIPFMGRATLAQEPLFKISLAQWSLHRTLQAKQLDNLDFAKFAKDKFQIEAVEYVNQFFFDKGGDTKYVAEMKKRAEDAGVKSMLIMCDREGNLGDPDDAKRKRAVENHHKWVEAAKQLGCHSVRVNAGSAGSYDEQIKLAADGLSRLSEFAEKFGLNVIVENHGGLSSNGQWLAAVIKTVDKKNCGTLPDFGNFRIKQGEEYDRYQGVSELMPFAKAVSAKSYDFDDVGNEKTIDFLRMMKIVVEAGYRGYVGIEYEGSRLGEVEGIAATKKLLETCLKKLTT
ncbi:MAG: sugar phosphate isomerase/epimerase [Planctomycetia bacterium]|nr:sugar phosphate isomerase/epimerase [Planctomycetia bacterium]